MFCMYRSAATGMSKSSIKYPLPPPSHIVDFVEAASYISSGLAGRKFGYASLVQAIGRLLAYDELGKFYSITEIRQQFLDQYNKMVEYTHHEKQPRSLNLVLPDYRPFCSAFIFLVKSNIGFSV